MTEASTNRAPALIDLACNIAVAYVSKNRLPVSELPGLLATLGSTLDQIAGFEASEEAASKPAKPTVAQIRTSVTPEALISFIDGKRYKTLKRHLTMHGLNPDSYRQQFGLPGDYPMSAPAYSERRAAIARSMGLGTRIDKRRKAR